MILNRGTCYAIYGMRYLAMNSQRAFVGVPEIARFWKMPEDHLSKLFQDLSKRGLVISKRGKSGGFALSKSPGMISVLDIYEALEGPVDVQSCLIHREKFSPCSTCDIVGPLQVAQREIRGVLGHLTLEKLLAGGA